MAKEQTNTAGRTAKKTCAVTTKGLLLLSALALACRDSATHSAATAMRPTKGVSLGWVTSVTDGVAVLRNEADETRQLRLETTECLQPGMVGSWCEDDCRTLSAVLVLPVSQVRATTTKEAAAPNDGRALISELKGETVVLKASSGETRTLQLSTTQCLTPGLVTSWCEEDCRVFTALLNYRVRERLR